MSLARAIQAAVGGRSMKSRLEEEKPEDLEEEHREDDATEEEHDNDAEGDDDEKPEADEDDVVTEDEDKPNAFARGRRAEKTRMSAILGSTYADRDPSLAAHLAFKTSMSAKDAIATLKASGGSQPQGGNLASRMQGRVPALGNGGGASKPRSADDALVSFAKNRNASRK
ncbi:hypothetical protein ACI0FM_08630 [Paenochrobactrum sp. BZR 588]|uniref:hypothetical protein n=1 Tax=Paenochrobactrum TaxID=999488 RepID=UPI0035BBE0D9